MCIDLVPEKPLQAIKKKEKLYEQNTLVFIKCSILSIQFPVSGRSKEYFIKNNILKHISIKKSPI